MKGHEGFEGFSVSYLKFLERMYLHRWKKFFQLTLSTGRQLSGVRDELNDRKNKNI